jgi:hypothetical protein
VRHGRTPGREHPREERLIEDDDEDHRDAEQHARRKQDERQPDVDLREGAAVERVLDSAQAYVTDPDQADAENAKRGAECLLGPVVVRDDPADADADRDRCQPCPPPREVRALVREPRPAGRVLDARLAIRQGAMRR